MYNNKLSREFMITKYDRDAVIIIVSILCLFIIFKITLEIKYKSNRFLRCVTKYIYIV